MIKYKKWHKNRYNSASFSRNISKFKENFIYTAKNMHNKYSFVQFSAYLHTLLDYIMATLYTHGHTNGERETFYKYVFWNLSTFKSPNTESRKKFRF